jgi:glutathione peroxidase-family protein
MFDGEGFLFVEKTEPPSWNFWKYLIDPNGKVIQAY